MNRPEYFTADEFLALVLRIARDEGYITDPENVKWHPEDLLAQLEPIMHTIAATVQHVLVKQRGMA